MHQEYFDLIPLKTSASGGQAGRRITVETNLLKFDFSKNFQTKIVHYDVTIVPNSPKDLLRTVFEEFRKVRFPNRYPAFDGKKNAYSANVLFSGKCVSNRLIIYFSYSLKDFFVFASYVFSIYLL